MGSCNNNGQVSIETATHSFSTAYLAYLKVYYKKILFNYHYVNMSLTALRALGHNGRFPHNREYPIKSIPHTIAHNIAFQDFPEDYHNVHH